MPHFQLSLSTTKPGLSWANHELEQREVLMTSNIASLAFLFKHIALIPDVHCERLILQLTKNNKKQVRLRLQIQPAF